MKTIVIILGVLVLVGGAYFLFKPSQEPAPSEPPPIAPPITSSETERPPTRPEQSDSVSIREIVTSSENAQIAELTDVSGGESSGIAYIARIDGTLYHYMMADLPEPKGGNKYEGWLIKQTPELMFFSTGVMELDESGIYMLSYSSDELNEGYDFVVITEETVVDATPETHILEGTAR